MCDHIFVWNRLDCFGRCRLVRCEENDDENEIQKYEKKNQTKIYK